MGWFSKNNKQHRSPEIALSSSPVSEAAEDAGTRNLERGGTRGEERRALETSQLEQPVAPIKKRTKRVKRGMCDHVEANTSSSITPVEEPSEGEHFEVPFRHLVHRLRALGEDHVGQPDKILTVQQAPPSSARLSSGRKQKDKAVTCPPQENFPDPNVLHLQHVHTTDESAGPSPVRLRNALKSDGVGEIMAARTKLTPDGPVAHGVRNTFPIVEMKNDVSAVEDAGNTAQKEEKHVTLMYDSGNGECILSSERPTGATDSPRGSSSSQKLGVDTTTAGECELNAELNNYSCPPAVTRKVCLSAMCKADNNIDSHASLDTDFGGMRGHTIPSSHRPKSKAGNMMNPYLTDTYNPYDSESCRDGAGMEFGAGVVPTPAGQKAESPRRVKQRINAQDKRVTNTYAQEAENITWPTVERRANRTSGNGVVEFGTCIQVGDEDTRHIVVEERTHIVFEERTHILVDPQDEKVRHPENGSGKNDIAEMVEAVTREKTLQHQKNELLGKLVSNQGVSVLQEEPTVRNFADTARVFEYGTDAMNYSIASRRRSICASQKSEEINLLVDTETKLYSRPETPKLSGTRDSTSPVSCTTGGCSSPDTTDKLSTGPDTPTGLRDEEELLNATSIASAMSKDVAQRSTADATRKDGTFPVSLPGRIPEKSTVSEARFGVSALATETVPARLRTFESGSEEIDCTPDNQSHVTINNGKNSGVTIIIQEQHSGRENGEMKDTGLSGSESNVSPRGQNSVTIFTEEVSTAKSAPQAKPLLPTAVSDDGYAAPRSGLSGMKMSSLNRDNIVNSGAKSQKARRSVAKKVSRDIKFDELEKKLSEQDEEESRAQDTCTRRDHCYRPVDTTNLHGQRSQEEKPVPQPISAGKRQSRCVSIQSCNGDRSATESNIPLTTTRSFPNRGRRIRDPMKLLTNTIFTPNLSTGVDGQSPTLVVPSLNTPAQSQQGTNTTSSHELRYTAQMSSGCGTTPHSAGSADMEPTGNANESTEMSGNNVGTSPNHGKLPSRFISATELSALTHGAKQQRNDMMAQKQEEFKAKEKYWIDTSVQVMLEQNAIQRARLGENCFLIHWFGERIPFIDEQVTTLRTSADTRSSPRNSSGAAIRGNAKSTAKQNKFSLAPSTTSKRSQSRHPWVVKGAEIKHSDAMQTTLEKTDPFPTVGTSTTASMLKTQGLTAENNLGREKPPKCGHDDAKNSPHYWLKQVALKLQELGYVIGEYCVYDSCGLLSFVCQWD